MRKTKAAIKLYREDNAAVDTYYTIYTAAAFFMQILQSFSRVCVASYSEEKRKNQFFIVDAKFALQDATTKFPSDLRLYLRLMDFRDNYFTETFASLSFFY